MLLNRLLQLYLHIFLAEVASCMMRDPFRVWNFFLGDLNGCTNAGHSVKVSEAA